MASVLQTNRHYLDKLINLIGYVQNSKQTEYKTKVVPGHISVGQVGTSF